MTATRQRPVSRRRRVTTSSGGVDSETRVRAESLLRREIEFVPNREFHLGSANRILESGKEAGLGGGEAGWDEPPGDLPKHLMRLCESPLLTQADEHTLFREMNYLKFRVNAMRTQIDPAAPSGELLDQADAWLARAKAVRDRIVLANMRLAMSIVKRFATPTCSFDELLSAGVVALMQAVEKFDYARGFRFSTYAYRAVSRSAYRTVMHRREETRRLSTGDVADPADEEGCRASTRRDGMLDELRASLARFVSRLDRRERFIIRSRYALGSHRRARTFQFLSEKLGVSKERARQLEQRAVKKLQQMAESAGLHDLFALAFDAR
ncbi:MAG: sigma-70 family RNA polymerase sigma factor [Planctomycetes bacterium]|nr:sigma-70 family RNA polymerase sigma factor [Planctomycetota bacterium]